MTNRPPARSVTNPDAKKNCDLTQTQNDSQSIQRGNWQAHLTTLIDVYF